MANPFYSWQKLLSRFGAGGKDLAGEVGRDDFGGLNFEAPFSFNKVK
jgi:hypothetical protein